ncbi:hypothetical protein [Flammeovirga sp. SJP92]|uniref:hypothetical protein n=1 Tax=Flammeovirga sp. SJP92 TaxID=1775430 RepID=UPI000786C331|nr:hypothetical protein [Flammeovirga sp. SJP92]KXX72547.1 hypothetical protein AVL50_00310 [Flammeovirga sp. SJP92]
MKLKNNKRHLVNIDQVGLKSADSAYGGYLNAYSFEEKIFDEWINDFKNLLLSKINTEYFPIYRMADGEFRFLMGRKLNLHKKPLIKELLAITAEKLYIRNPNKWKTSWGEEYSPDVVSNLRKKLIEDIRYISKKGILACYYNENGLNAFTEYNKYLEPFFLKNNIPFNNDNYYPFHFVCSVLIKNNYQDFYRNKNILIATGSDDDSEEKIKSNILQLGAKSVSFIRISKTKSMQEKIDLSEIKINIDICFVAAGIGSASILKQLEPLRTLTIDIGGFINCFIDKTSSQHGGIFSHPEKNE